MGSVSRQPGFPLAATATALTAVGAGLGILGMLVVPAIFGHPAGATEAVVLAACVTWVGSMAALVPVHSMGPLGVLPTVWAYFLGATARLLVCLAAFGVGVKAAQLPAKPMAATLVGMYLPLLFVEAACVGRYLWKKDFLPKPPHPERGAGPAAGQVTEVPA